MHRQQVALFGDVKGQVGAHNGKADQPDIRRTTCIPPGGGLWLARFLAEASLTANRKTAAP